MRVCGRSPSAALMMPIPISFSMRATKAVTAAAHKLARLIYALLSKGAEYVDRGLAHEEERYRHRTLQQLTRRAKALGYALTQAHPREPSCFLRGSRGFAEQTGFGLATWYRHERDIGWYGHDLDNAGTMPPKCLWLGSRK